MGGRQVSHRLADAALALTSLTSLNGLAAGALADAEVRKAR